MNYATQIVDGLRASVIEKILVVDDAYDPPTLSRAHEGDLLEVLQRPDLREYVTTESLGEEDLESAIEALSGGESDHEAIGDAISSLFSVYVRQRTAEIDPGGAFADLRGASLMALDSTLGAS